MILLLVRHCEVKTQEVFIVSQMSEDAILGVAFLYGTAMLDGVQTTGGEGGWEIISLNRPNGEAPLEQSPVN